MGNKRLYQKADDQAGQSSAFCPNCGQAVKPDDVFCGNCGFDLKKFRQAGAATQATMAPTTQPTTATTTEATTTTVAPTTAATQAPLPARHTAQRHFPRWAGITIAVIVVLAIGGYWFGNHYYQPAAQLSRDINLIKSGKSGLAKQMTSSDPSLSLTEAKVKPFVKYFDGNRQALAHLSSQLKYPGTSPYGISFVKSGKAWLFFDKYKLKVTSVYATLATNHSGVKLAVDGKTVATTTGSKLTKKVGPLVPGKYQLSAKGTVNGHQMTNKGTYNLLQSNSDAYDLELRTISLSVEGAENTVVYVNDEKAGTIGSSGSLALKDIPWSNQMNLVGKYKVGGKTLTSKTTNVSSADGTSVSLSFDGVLSKSSADTMIGNMFTALGYYTSSGDLSDATTDDDRSFDDYFVNGTDNANYQEFIKMAKGYYDDDDIDSVDYTPTIISVTPSTSGQCLVTYDVKYDFVNTDNEKIQVFRYTATIEKSGGHYKVVKISGAQKIRSYTEDDDD